MSNTELYYEQLTDLSVRIAEGIKNRTDPLKDLNDKLTQLSQTNAIKGSAANSMKAYIGEVHMTLIQTMQLLLNNYEMALGKYVRGYLGVDSNESFKLVKEDFDDHEHKLSSHRSDFTSIGSKLKAISDEAEDIISLAGAGSKRLFNVAKEMDAMKKTVNDLKDSWNSYEQTDPGFNEVQELIAQTKALLKSTLSVPRGYSYSPGSFSKLMSKNFVDAFIANANYAQDANNQKAFKDDWDSISKNYTADQKRMAEEAKKKAEEEGLIGLIWDGLQICAGTALVVTGVGTGFGVVLIAGGVNSAINHASMAVNGKSFNIVGNLTNGAVQWYNKNIGEPLVKTGNPVAKFVAGLGNGGIEVAGGMGQFSVYDMGKTVHTLATNPQARAQFGAGIGSWWNQVRSGDAYTIGQTTAVAASLFLGGKDINTAVSSTSKAESLLGKAGMFTKSIAVSSVKNVKSLITLPGKALDDLKKAAGFVNERLIPASGKAVKDFGKLVKDAGEDLKGLNPQGEFVTDNGFAFSVGNDIKLSDVGNNLKNGVRDIRDNFVKAVKSADKEEIQVSDDVPIAFRQTEFASSYESRINQTPGEENLKVGFEGRPRGESLCTLKPPPDIELSKILDGANIDGIEYRNGVPDFSPVSKAQVEIDHMQGGVGVNGNRARVNNFAQADQKLADQLNNSPELAQQFGMESGDITADDISDFRKSNKLTWHEVNDVKTIQLVPSKINKTFGHLGGVGEINAGAFRPGGFACE